MFRAILFTQWKWTRWILGVLVLVSFTVPIMSVQHAGLGFGSADNRFVAQVLSTVEFYSLLYPVLAAVVALTVAATAWGADEKGKHVYALSLPVPRWHYVLLRLGAGGVLLTGPVLGIAGGALVASAAATLPPGMEAHPIALVSRFALALGVAYALIFGIMAGGERLGHGVAGVLGSLVVMHVVLAMLGIGDLIRLVGEALLLWPGPFEIFTGRWMLIDV